MGKRKGQTHDYRVEFIQTHQPPGARPQRRVRDNLHVAQLLTRDLARQENTVYAELIWVDPANGREHVLAHYTHDNPPPDNDDALRPRKGRPAAP